MSSPHPETEAKLGLYMQGPARQSSRSQRAGCPPAASGGGSIGFDMSNNAERETEIVLDNKMGNSDFILPFTIPASHSI